MSTWRLVIVGLASAAGACAHHRAEVPVASLNQELAEVLVAHHAYEAAIPLLQDAVAREPHNARVRTMLGIVLRDHRVFAEARKELGTAWRLDPTDADTAAAWGVLLDTEGEGEMADIWHRRSIALGGERADHFNNLGFSQFLRGQLTDAIATYHHALSRDPGMRRVYNNLGFAQARLGRFDDAWQSFQQAAPRARALSNLALAYERAGSLREARAFYEEALGIDAKLKVARRNLERLAAAHPADPPAAEEASR